MRKHNDPPYKTIKTNGAMKGINWFKDDKNFSDRASDYRITH